MKNKEPFFSRIKTSNKILFCGDICLNDDDYNISNLQLTYLNKQTLELQILRLQY